VVRKSIAQWRSNEECAPSEHTSGTPYNAETKMQYTIKRVHRPILHSMHRPIGAIALQCTVQISKFSYVNITQSASFEPDVARCMQIWPCRIHIASFILLADPQGDGFAVANKGTVFWGHLLAGAEQYKCTV
jgi:hypothetical protein